MTMSYGGLEVELGDNGVAVLTMCNGENKFNMDYLHSWHQALDDIERSTNCTALITIGKDKFFSSGLDVSWLRKSSPALLDAYHDELHRLYKRIMSLGMTTVAVVNGHAIAEGAFIALVHDYRVMREDKGWLQWPEVHVKLPMTPTMLDILRIKLPTGNALRDAVVFGKRFNAENAKLLGIVDIVSSEIYMMSQAKLLIQSSYGKNEIERGFLNDMKTDLYKDFVTDETLSAKL